MLTLNKISYRWPGAATDCLCDISLQLKQGEWLALTGDNGAGKSTLLRVMAGLLTPTAGTVMLQQQAMKNLKNRQRAAKVGVLFQEAENQLFHSTVADEIAFGLKLQKCPADEITQRTNAALQCCQLADTASAHPLDLHSAQRRMVAVACLEALSPPLLLLDEPSRDFDENWLSVFESWLEKCRQRGTQQQAMKNLKNRQRAAKVGVLFQEAENQLFHSTVADEIAFGLKLQKCPADEITQRTNAALQCCQLADTASAHPLDLHSAQRRMVAVACLEALSPPLLLLDEPSRDFDENWLSVFESWLEKCRQRGTQRRMVAVACLEALSPPLLLLDEPSRDFDENWLSVFESWLEKCRQRGTSVVAISHDAAFTRRHFSRVVRLEDGVIRNVNPSDDIHP